jgi:hypothetical protein
MLMGFCKPQPKLSNHNIMKKILFLIVLYCISGMAIAQDWQWAQSGGGDGFDGNQADDDIEALETDSQGNIFMVGNTFEGNTQIAGTPVASYGYNDKNLASFTCNGQLRWAVTLGSAFPDNTPFRICLDAAGDVYLTGVVSYPNTFDPITFHFSPTTFLPSVLDFPFRTSMFLAKYSGATGELLWHLFPQDQSNQTISNAGVRIYFDSTDNSINLFSVLEGGSYCNGQLIVPNPATNYYMLKYSTSGDFMGYIPLQGNRLTGAFMKKSPVNGNLYVAGIGINGIVLNGVTVTAPWYVACFSATGQYLWHKTLVAPNGINTNLSAFDLDEQGFLYVHGSGKGGDSYDSYTFTNAYIDRRPFLLKIHPDTGAVVWGSEPTTVNGQSIGSSSMKVVGNEVIVSPEYQTLTWGGGYPYIPFVTTIDASLFRFNKDTGAPVGNTRIEAGGTEYITQITSDPLGNIIVGGNFNFRITVNGVEQVNNGSNRDYFIAKFGSNNCTFSTQNPSAVTLKLYPNPAQEVLYVTVTQPTEYVVYNTLGQELQKGSIANPEEGVDVKALTAGSYILSLRTATGAVERLQFVKR